LAFKLGVGKKREDDRSKTGKKIYPLRNLWVKRVTCNDTDYEFDQGKGDTDF
jgi:hypothetical protein